MPTFLFNWIAILVVAGELQSTDLAGCNEVTALGHAATSALDKVQSCGKVQSINPAGLNYNLLFTSSIEVNPVHRELCEYPL